MKRLLSRFLSLTLILILSLSSSIIVFAEAAGANVTNNMESGSVGHAPGVCTKYPALRCKFDWIPADGYKTYNEVLSSDKYWGSYDRIISNYRNLMNECASKSSVGVLWADNTADGGFVDVATVFDTDENGGVVRRDGIQHPENTMSFHCLPSADHMASADGVWEGGTIQLLNYLAAYCPQKDKTPIKQTLRELNKLYEASPKDPPYGMKLVGGMYLSWYLCGVPESRISTICSNFGFTREQVHAVCMYCLAAWNTYTMNGGYGDVVIEFVNQCNAPGSDGYMVFTGYECRTSHNVVNKSGRDMDVLMSIEASTSFTGDYKNFRKTEPGFKQNVKVSGSVNNSTIGLLKDALRTNENIALVVARDSGDHCIHSVMMGGPDKGKTLWGAGYIGIDLGISSDNSLEIEALPDEQEVVIKAGAYYPVDGTISMSAGDVNACLSTASNIKMTLTIEGDLTPTEIYNVGGYGDIKVTSPAGCSNNGNVFVWDNINPVKVKALIEGSEDIVFTSSVKAEAALPSIKGYYMATAVFEIQNTSGDTEVIMLNAGSTAAGHGGVAVTGVPGHFGPDYTVHDPVNFVGKPVSEKIYWEYHSHLATGGVPNAYAQIKANECKHEDWAVLQGIPSTENLFIACGGTLYTVDVGGSFEAQGSIKRRTTFVVNTAPQSNKTNGSVHGGAATTGSLYTTLDPCVLKCTTHSVSVSHDCIVSGKEGACDTHFSSNNKPCPTCGEGGDPGDCTFEEAVEEETDEAGEIVTEGKDEVPCKTEGEEFKCGNKITGATYNCSTDTWTLTTSSEGYAEEVTWEKTTAGVPNSSNQHYTNSVITWECPHCNGKGTVTWTEDIITDEGYTKGTGCTCDNKCNFEHPGRGYGVVAIDEEIQDIYFLNISQYAVYGLAGFKTTDYNKACIDSGTGGVDNSYGIDIWDLKGSDVKGGTKLTAGEVCAGYASGDGRIIFSAYPYGNYVNGPGWISSSPCLEVEGRAPGFEDVSIGNYMLGDCRVTIYVFADNPNGTKYTANSLETTGVDVDGGSKDTEVIAKIGTTQGVDDKVTQDNYSSGMMQNGCYMDETRWKNQCAAVINQYMKINGADENSFPTVVSDQMSLMPYDQENKQQYQDVVNSMYTCRPNGGDSAPGKVFTLGTDHLKGEHMTVKIPSPSVGGECHVIDFPSAVPAIEAYRTVKYKSPKVMTVDDLWKNNRGFYNFRALYDDSNISTVGFMGSPGGIEGESSYQDLQGSELKSDVGGAKSLESLWTIVPERNGHTQIENLIITGGGGSAEFSGLTPYTHAKCRFTQSLVSSGGGNSEFSGYYNDYVYTAKGASASIVNNVSYSGAAKVIPTSDVTALIGVTDTMSGNCNQYNVPFVISNIGIIDYAVNGPYSKPVSVNAYYKNIATLKKCLDEEEPCAPTAPEWDTTGITEIGKRFNGSLDFQNEKGVPVGFYGMNTDINMIVIHDPASVKYCYIESNGLTSPGNDDRASMHEDTKNSEGRLEKKDYFVMGNDIYVWYSDYDDFYDSAGSWNGVTGSSVKGTGRPDNLYNMSDEKISYSDLCRYYDYGGHSHGDTTGYKDAQYMTNWVFDRYVKFPFSVTYESVSCKDNTQGLGTALAGNLLAVSDMYAYRWNGSEFVKITNGSEAATFPIPGLCSTTNGPDAYLYPEEFSKATGHERVHGWFLKFTMNTSAVETDCGVVSFITVTKKNVGDGHTEPDEVCKNINQGSSLVGYNVTISASDYISATSSNNYERNYGYIKAEPNVKKNCEVDVVGRIGNLTIEDTGDFRYSELFKQPKKYSDGSQIYYKWLIDGVVHETDQEASFKVAADRLNIMNVLASYRTNGHATTSVTYMDSKTEKGNNVKTGKASPEFATLPLTPAQNNNPAFKSEAMRMGYYLYMDIDTWGNYYGINTIDKTECPDISIGSIVHTDPIYDENGNMVGTSVSYDNVNLPSNNTKYGMFDDTEEYERKYKMDIDIRYMLLDLVTGDYIPIDIYYGEDGDRTPVVLWRNALESNFKLYEELGKELSRRNITKLEKTITNIGTEFLTARRDNDVIINPLDYSQDYIGGAGKLVLDQKNRTFIGSSLINGDLHITNDGTGDKLVSNLSPVVTYNWDDIKLGQNDLISGQHRYNGWNGFKYSPYLHSNNDRLGGSEVEYMIQSQRWHFSIGLPSTAYIVPSDKGPNFTGTPDEYHDYRKDYVPTIDTSGYSEQLKIEKLHEALLEEHPNSVVVPLMKIVAKGEVFELDYTDGEETFIVYDDDAKTQPPEVIYEDPNHPKPDPDNPGHSIPKEYPKPDGFKEWTIPTVFEPEFTSSDDLAIIGTH